MPTQFDKVMAKMDTILDHVHQIRIMVENLTEKDELFGEDPFDQYEDYGTADESGMEQEMMYMPREPVKPRPSATRTHVEVRNPDEEGGVEMVPWTEVDERIIEAVRLSSEMNEPWELWRDPSGMIRVSVEASVAHQIRKANTYQQPAPRSAEIPRDMDVDEVAKEK